MTTADMVFMGSYVVWIFVIVFLLWRWTKSKPRPKSDVTEGPVAQMLVEGLHFTVTRGQEAIVDEVAFSGQGTLRVLDEAGRSHRLLLKGEDCHGWRIRVGAVLGPGVYRVMASTKRITRGSVTLHVTGER